MTPQIIGFIIVFILIAIFILTYVWNKRTPIPKGCELINEEACAACHNHGCTIKKRGD